jgi:hypothetical protein
MGGKSTSPELDRCKQECAVLRWERDQSRRLIDIAVHERDQARSLYRSACTRADIAERQWIAAQELLREGAGLIRCLNGFGDGCPDRERECHECDARRRMRAAAPERKV